MPKNLPAVRKNNITIVSKSERAVSIEPPLRPLVPVNTAPAPIFSEPQSLSGMTVDRRALAQALRFASRVASRGAIPALGCCLLRENSIVAINLDLSLRVEVRGVQDLGVLIPAEALYRCVAGTKRPEVTIRRRSPVNGQPFAISVDGAVLVGYDAEEFPDTSKLFPAEEPKARARFQTLESVLVAASTDDTRKNLCAVFFQLCKNVVVATDGHRLHSLEIVSGDEGDFLVPRKAIELIENIRRATRTPDVRANFFDDQAVFQIGDFEVAARYETATFPAWEEVIPGKPKYELRVPRVALLDALDQAAAAMGERYSGVRLRRLAEGLEIHGKNPDAGELSTVIPARGWKDGEMIGLNLSYVYEAVKFAPSEEVTIGITDDIRAIKIRDGAYLAVVMPMRL